LLEVRLIWSYQQMLCVVMETWNEVEYPLSVIYTFFLWSQRGIFSVSTAWLWYWKLCQCDVKHIMTLMIKTIQSIFDISTFINVIILYIKMTKPPL
jgi:hypothetical protein